MTATCKPSQFQAGLARMQQRGSSHRGTHLEQVRELGVAVGDVGGLGCQRGKHIAQAAEGLVDLAGLLQLLPLHI